MGRCKRVARQPALRRVATLPTGVPDLDVKNNAGLCPVRDLARTSGLARLAILGFVRPTLNADSGRSPVGDHGSPPIEANPLPAPLSCLFTGEDFSSCMGE